MFDPIGYQVAIDALNDPEIDDKEKISWKAYKFYCKHGYNKRINYRLHESLQVMLEKVVDGELLSFLRDNPDLPYTDMGRRYEMYKEAYSGHLKTRKNGDEIATTIIDALKEKFDV